MVEFPRAAALPWPKLQLFFCFLSPIIFPGLLHCEGSREVLFCFIQAFLLNLLPFDQFQHFWLLGLTLAPNLLVHSLSEMHELGHQSVGFLEPFIVYLLGFD